MGKSPESDRNSVLLGGSARRKIGLAILTLLLVLFSWSWTFWRHAGWYSVPLAVWSAPTILKSKITSGSEPSSDQTVPAFLSGAQIHDLFVGKQIDIKMYGPSLGERSGVKVYGPDVGSEIELGPRQAYSKVEYGGNFHKLTGGNYFLDGNALCFISGHGYGPFYEIECRYFFERGEEFYSMKDSEPVEQAVVVEVLGDARQ